MANRRTYDDLTPQIAAEEAEHWLSNFIPSLEHLEQHAQMEDPKREYFARLISALMEAKANALLVRSECVRERAQEAIDEAVHTQPFIADLSRVDLRRVLLTWHEEDRIRVVRGRICVRIKVLRNRRVVDSYRPLTQRMLEVYGSLAEQGLLQSRVSCLNWFPVSQAGSSCDVG